VPPAGVLRRERRALLRYREERLRDLGGLLLEMFRRDRFREDLVRERCEELLELDDHLGAIDSLLGVAWAPPEPARCACGAPVANGAEFCSSCGRSLGPATRSCPACGSTAGAGAAYCDHCGARTDGLGQPDIEPNEAEQQLEHPPDRAAEG
jgi:Double zinc ribbon